MQLIGRASLFLPPGDRFARIEHEAERTTPDGKEYSYLWKSFLQRGRNIKYIRPATKKEVWRWIYSHQKDAQFIKRIVVGGVKVNGA
jgi:hypothetical protein